jgi:hypothetical protein
MGALSGCGGLPRLITPCEAGASDRIPPWPRAAPPKRRDYVYLTHAQVLTLARETGCWPLLILLLTYTGLRWG